MAVILNGCRSDETWFFAVVAVGGFGKSTGKTKRECLCEGWARISGLWCKFGPRNLRALIQKEMLSRGDEFLVMEG